MGNRSSRNALVAFSCALDAGYATPTVGHMVKITASYTVDEVAAATDNVVGEVVSVEVGADNLEASVVVEASASKIKTLLSAAAVTAGQFAVISSSTEARDYNAGGGDTADMISGLFLQSAAGAAAAVDVLLF